MCGHTLWTAFSAWFCFCENTEGLASLSRSKRCFKFINACYLLRLNVLGTFRILQLQGNRLDLLRPVWCAVLLLHNKTKSECSTLPHRSTRTYRKDQKYQIDEHGGELIAWVERLACTFIDLAAVPKQPWLECTGSILERAFAHEVASCRHHTSPHLKKRLNISFFSLFFGEPFLGEEAQEDILERAEAVAAILKKGTDPADLFACIQRAHNIVLDFICSTGFLAVLKECNAPPFPTRIAGSLPLRKKASVSQS